MLFCHLWNRKRRRVISESTSESRGVTQLWDGCDRGTEKGTRAEHPPGGWNISEKLKEKELFLQEREVSNVQSYLKGK